MEKIDWSTWATVETVQEVAEHMLCYATICWQRGQNEEASLRAQLAQAAALTSIAESLLKRKEGWTLLKRLWYKTALPMMQLQSKARGGNNES